MGYARLDAGLKESLKRDQPRPVRAYNKGLTVTHAHLISLFTRRQWERYEHLYLRWGKGPGGIQLLFKRIQERGITSGPIYELAKLRTQDRSVHQKVLGMIRYRWTNYHELSQQKINDDEEQYWERMAKRIINRGKEYAKYRSRAWQGKQALPRLIQHLKTLWQEQNGLCAESHLPMQLKIGADIDDKCSPDRIDSTRPYDPDNIRLVCYWVNIMKMDTPQDLFETRIRMLYEAISARIS